MKVTLATPPCVARGLFVLSRFPGTRSIAALFDGTHYNC